MAFMLQKDGCGGVSTLAFWHFLVQQVPSRSDSLALSLSVSLPPPLLYQKHMLSQVLNVLEGNERG